MKCEEALSRFLDLDCHEPPSQDVAAHFASCGSCRKAYERLSLGMMLLPGSVEPKWLSTEEEQIRLVNQTMLRIRTEVEQDDQNAPSVALGRWIIAGVIIVAAMPLATFSDSVQWLRGILGSRLDFPMNLVFGLIIAIYSLLFIGSHLKEIARFLHVRTHFASRK